MFDLNILEKQPEDALENKSVKKPNFKKNNLSNNKQAPKNKNKTAHRAWFEKGKPYSRNIKMCNMFLLYAKGAYFK